MSENSILDDKKKKGQWTRAYYTILVLSAFLIPIMTFLAHVATSQITEVTHNGTPISDMIALPTLTAWYASIGTKGLVIIGAFSGLIIIALALIRHSIFSVVFSGISLIFSILFMAIAQSAALLPYLVVIPTLVD